MLYENDKERYKMKHVLILYLYVLVVTYLKRQSVCEWILYFVVNVAVLDDLLRMESAKDLHAENARSMLSFRFEILNHDTTENCVFILTLVSWSWMQAIFTKAVSELNITMS